MQIFFSLSSIVLTSCNDKIGDHKLMQSRTKSQNLDIKQAIHMAKLLYNWLTCEIIKLKEFQYLNKNEDSIKFKKSLK